MFEVKDNFKGSDHSLLDENLILRTLVYMIETNKREMS
jgi:hypothetical protein